MACNYRHHQLLATLRHVACWFLCVVAQAGSAARAASDSGGGSFTTVAMWIIGTVFTSIIIITAVTVKNRLDRQRERERMAEAAFEARIINAYRDDLETIQPVAAAEGLATAEQAFASAAVLDELLQPIGEGGSHLSPAAPASAPASGDGKEAWEKVYDRLFRSGIIEGVEGHLELNGNPKAAKILTMRDRRRALLVPYFETDVFAEKNLKRFELLIFVTRSGEAVIISPMDELIANHVTKHF